MRKLNSEEYEHYWNNVHMKITDDLAAVCFPDKPAYFNAFYDNIQKYALNKYFTHEKISFKGKKVLDIGCGRGRWLSFYKKRYGAQAVGIDLSESAVHACQNQGLDAHVGSITCMPYEDQCFDFVNSITVLMHLPDQLKEKAIAEIARVLKSGGNVFILEATWKDPSPHVFSFSVLEWEKLFKKYGMRLIYKSAHCFNLFRRKLPFFPIFRDFISIYLDYPLEFLLMNYFYGKQSNVSLQHLLVFEK